MIITSVERTGKKGDMVKIAVDGHISFSVHEEDYIRLCLYEGVEISEREIDDIKRNIVFRGAKSVAVGYVARRIRTEKEIADKLANSGYYDDIIRSVLDELNTFGYINDYEYAKRHVLDRINLNPKSSDVIRYELRQKGVNDDIIEDVLNEAGYDDISIAEGLVRKKFRGKDFEDKYVSKKIYSFLCTRGFGFEVSNEVIKRINGDYRA